MNMLREYIKQILLERKIEKAMAAGLFSKKVKTYLETISAEDNVAFVSSRALEDNVVKLSFTIQPYSKPEDYWDMSYQDQREFDQNQRELLKQKGGIYEWINNSKEKYENAFDTFANRRGWNVLETRYQPQPGTGGAITIVYIFDHMASKKNPSSFFGEATELSLQGWRLFHLTKTVYANKIKRSGIKPSRISSDNIKFGSGRSYFTLIKEPDESKIRNFFSEMSSLEDFAGIGTNEQQSVIELDLNNMPRGIKFYRDTEFFKGTGKINNKSLTDGRSAAIAVWTSTHIPENAIINLYEVKK